MKLGLTFASVVAISCSTTANDPQYIAVTSHNGLGVTELEVSHSASADGNVFELAGFAAGHDQVASVRLLVGTVADLPNLLPTTSTFGSEITLTYGGAVSNRLVSRETHRLQLSVNANPDLQSFLEISEVATTLQHEANIVVAHADSSEAAYTYVARSCTASYLLASPIAGQCCQQNPGALLSTVFKPTSGKNEGLVITRYQNPEGTGCKAENGTGSCSGDSGANPCYYGPAGFSNPVIDSGTGSDNIYVSNLEGLSICEAEPGVSPSFGNVTGTVPRGEGCPGASPGSDAGGWDY
jgi:hypothetical protein